MGVSKRGHSASSLGLRYFTKMLWFVILCSMLLESRLGKALYIDSPGSEFWLRGLWSSHFAALRQCPPHTVPASEAGQESNETKTDLIDALLIN